MASETGQLRRLEAKAPMLLLLGGALYGVSVAGLILTTYTGSSFPGDLTIAALGKVLIPLGLLGLYPALVERRPYLSRAAAAVAVIPLAAWSLVVVGGGILEPAGIVDGAPGPLVLTPLVGFIGLYTAFALFGITILLTDVHPRLLGVLLLVYPAMIPLWVTVLSGVPTFVSALADTLVFVGVGVVLWNAGVPTAEVEPAADPTV